jgi:hypothetical protein
MRTMKKYKMGIMEVCPWNRDNEGSDDPYFLGKHTNTADMCPVRPLKGTNHAVLRRKPD